MRRVIAAGLFLVAAACAPDTTTPSTGPATTGVTSGEDASTVTVRLAPTPSQQEGPYYPVIKPDDRDSDLTVVAGAAGAPRGEVLLLDGVLLTTVGEPVAGAVIEIWQTDHQGIYLHPDDPRGADRDENFQSYGESVTDTAGTWSFRTIDPGYYEPRPRHIHLKVRLNGSVVLTTQIYFSGDGRLSSEPEALIAETRRSEEGGSTVLIAEHTLVVDL